MVIFILLMLGLCFGSFVNAFVWRLHNKRDWVRERSECTHCHHELAPKDLVPVLSWLLLRGKCRYCHKKIDDNPLAELVTALLFVISYLFWPVAFGAAGISLFVFWLVFIVGFVALTLYDLKWMLLPNKIVFPLIGLAIIQWLIVIFIDGNSGEIIKDISLSVLVGGGIFYAIFHVSGGKWIGGGDVKLGILLGLILGDPVKSMLLLFIASLVGTLIAVPLLLAGKADRKTHLPFGPFLIIATIIVQLFGPEIITLYESQLLLAVI